MKFPKGCLVVRKETERLFWPYGKKVFTVFEVNRMGEIFFEEHPEYGDIGAWNASNFEPVLPKTLNLDKFK